MKLYIKNMVCNRCKIVIKSILEQLGLHPTSIELGEVEISENEINKIKNKLHVKLLSVGFELIDDKRSRIIEKTKNLIIDLVHNKNNHLNINLSEYLAQSLDQDYNTLSNLFSEVENTTIEKYFISQRIEKVKELLTYDELTLSEIAFRLNYSTVSHLSNQFKKITGFTPGYFKKIKDIKRKQIDNL